MDSGNGFNDLFLMAASQRPEDANLADVYKATLVAQDRQIKLERESFAAQIAVWKRDYSVAASLNIALKRRVEELTAATTLAASMEIEDEKTDDETDEEPLKKRKYSHGYKPRQKWDFETKKSESFLSGSSYLPISLMGMFAPIGSYNAQISDAAATIHSQSFHEVAFLQGGVPLGLSIPITPVTMDTLRSKGRVAKNTFLQFQVDGLVCRLYGPALMVGENRRPNSAPLSILMAKEQTYTFEFYSSPDSPSRYVGPVLNGDPKSIALNIFPSCHLTVLGKTMVAKAKAACPVHGPPNPAKGADCAEPIPGPVL